MTRGSMGFGFSFGCNGPNCAMGLADLDGSCAAVIEVD